MRTLARAVAALLLIAACGESGGGSVERPATTRAPAPTAPSTTSRQPSSTRIEYQPGVDLVLHTPSSPCGDERRPALVSSGGPAALLAERGYVVAMVNARRPGYDGTLSSGTLGSFAWEIHDLAVAVQWLRAHADEHCLEPGAIGAIGTSHGGIAALGLLWSDGVPKVGNTVTVDELGGSADVAVTVPPAPAELSGLSRDIAAAVSFVGFALPQWIDAGDRPALLVNGRFDTTIPIVLAERTCEAARAVGVTCELTVVDAGHGFTARQQAAALQQAAEFLDREMLAPAGLSPLG